MSYFMRLARFAAEEFVVIPSEAGIEGALIVAETTGERIQENTVIR